MQGKSVPTLSNSNPSSWHGVRGVIVRFQVARAAFKPESPPVRPCEWKDCYRGALLRLGWLVLITLLNFARYNPRGDVKNPSWVRLERTWWHDMYSWSADAQRVWFMLLGLASFKTGACDVEPDFIAGNLHLEISAVLASLDFLVTKRRIEIATCADVTRTLRGRDVDGTSTGVTYERTDGVGGVLENLDSPRCDTETHAHAGARVDPETAKLLGAGLAKRAEGAIRQRLTEDQARERIGPEGWSMILACYDGWEDFTQAFSNAYRLAAAPTVATAQLRDAFAAEILIRGGEDA